MSTNTPPMPATFKRLSDHQSKFTFPAPNNPLFLGQLIISDTAPVDPGILGNVDPGGASATKPAHHTLTNGDDYAGMVDFVNNCTGAVAVALTYEDDFSVTACTPIDLGLSFVTVETTTVDVVTVEFQGRDGGDSNDDGRDRIAITEVSATEAMP
jgi:hypothetical protein